jgi:two-component system, NarL family, nitrate/nitrite response regulator NarL
MTEVVVVAPIRVHRESLSTALEEAASLKVVGEAATLDEALPELRDRQRPAVALLDGPPLDDLVLAAPPLATEPRTRVVAVGVPESDAVDWIEAGASGVVPPDGSVEDVIAALESVADDELVAPPHVTGELANRVRRLAAESPDAIPEDRLTSRETEVLGLLHEGLSNKQIAQRLSIQVSTVKNHVHGVLVKLGVSGRAEAAAWRRRCGRHAGDQDQ